MLRKSFAGGLKPLQLNFWLCPALSNIINQKQRKTKNTNKLSKEQNGNWISRSNLPQRNRGYDMYNARKVVSNKQKPYLHHQDDREKYALSDGHSI